MPTPMSTLTAASLIAALQKMPTDAEVRVWLPGTTIALSSVFEHGGQVRVEGDIEPGSALDTEAPAPAAPADGETRYIPLNGPTVEIEPKTDRPRAFTLTEGVAETTSRTGERLAIVRSVASPFRFEIRGDKAVGHVNIEPIFQEAMLHVLRENF
jgi:hypothetical protein